MKLKGEELSIEHLEETTKSEISTGTEVLDVQPTADDEKVYTCLCMFYYTEYA